MESKWFTRKEFACKCGKCDFDVVDAELLKVLERLREDFGKPVIITSACRCKEHNVKIGGASKSKHLLGKAADVRVKDVDPHDVYEYLCVNYSDKYGIGNANSFTHIDVRDYAARWKY